ncbi:hypothetical protein RHMOL_Rhmol05G0044100 [Rhododendron molle]|uniref:Uncharacterized protein n=1 Tax=Rhododendron molle TaxID=49168 RepID=A0ACC0NKQ5_RHOML|nr:hypothetical protein RHMOL_Rhmol05G0044100 [Rhododendron molle]
MHNWRVIVDEAVGQLSQLVAKEHLEGELKVPPVEAKQRVEFIGVQMILDLGTVDPAKYPLPHTRLTLESLRDYVHLRPRTNTISAIARFRNALAYATHTFFQNHGFLYVHTPVITTSDCEGAGEMFQLTTLISDAEKLEELIKNPPPAEADGEVAKLLVMEKGEAIAQLKSAKANKETISAAVAELTKAKEKHSHTSWHLAEFWMVEPEIAFSDIQDDMNCAVAFVRSLCQWLLDNCLDDMEFMVTNWDKSAIDHRRNRIDRPRTVSSTKFVRICYTEAVAILEEALKERQFENIVEWGIDLASEHDRYLTKVKFKSLVIVYDYLKGIKACYMKVNRDDKTVAAMDVLVLKESGKSGSTTAAAERRGSAEKASKFHSHARRISAMQNA